MKNTFLKKIKSISLFLFFVLGKYTVFSQDNNLHKINQYINTNENILSFFLENEFQIKNNNYIILIPPSICSRCEGLINPMINNIKKNDTDFSLNVVYVYTPEKFLAVKDYNERKKIELESFKIISNKNSFLENFNISSKEILVPYLLKFNSQGDLMVSVSFLGLNLNDSLCISIVNHKKPLFKTIKYDSQNDKSTPIMDKIIYNAGNLLNILKPYKKITLPDPKDYHISRLENLFVDKNNIIFKDQLSEKILHFKIYDSTVTLYTQYFPSSFEMNYYINKDVPSWCINYLKSNNILNTMYFNTFVIDSSVFISASLPYVYLEDNENIGYKNNAVILKKNSKNNKFKEIIQLKIPDTRYKYDHTSLKYVNNINKIIVPIYKGWPVRGAEVLNENDTLDNPFLDNFYDTTYLFSIFDLQGNHYGFCGSLSPLYKQKKLGYYCSFPLISNKKNGFYYCDSRTGSVNSFSIDKLSNKNIELFSIFKLNNNTNIFIDKNNPMLYMNQWLSNFNNLVMDFKVSEDSIFHFIIKEKEIYRCESYSKTGILINVNYLPTKVYDTEVCTYRFIEGNKNLNIVALGYETNKTVAYYFNL